MNNVGAVILGGLMDLLSKMPLRVHYKLCGGLAGFMNHVVHYRRKVVLVNLSRSFPQLKYHELNELSNQFYEHFGELIAEAIWIRKKPFETLRKQGLCYFTNPEVLNDAFDNSPSTMVMISHCGNWELVGTFNAYDNAGGVKLHFDDKDTCVVYKKMTSKAWDKVLADNRSGSVVRERGGKPFEGYVETYGIMRYAVSHRHDKKVYIFNTDQHPYKGATGVDVPDFMHQKTQAMTGAAVLAAKLHMSILFLSFDRVSKGHYELTATEISRDAATMTPEDIMARYYQLVEDRINAHPANYLWSHKRWK